MPTTRVTRRLNLFILCAGIVSATLIFGMRAIYAPGIHFGIVAVQFAVICLSAVALGGWAARSGSDERRLFATAGLLLITPFALFSLLAGIGPPGGQTADENQLRYVVLLISSIVVGGGFLVLREALRKSGEEFYSTLGFAAIVFATPAYITWGGVMVELFREAKLPTAGEAQAWHAAMTDLTDILLFFAGVLTYLATAAFAAALARKQLMRRGASIAMITLSFIALGFLATRGLKFPNPDIVFQHWYTIPSFIVSIPAVPWMMPCMIGIVLLWRAGNEKHWSAD